MRSFACGQGNRQQQQDVTRHVQASARALADAIIQTEATCKSGGGEDTQACGFTQAEVETVARAQVGPTYNSRSGLFACMAVRVPLR